MWIRGVINTHFGIPLLLTDITPQVLLVVPGYKGVHQDQGQVLPINFLLYHDRQGAAIEVELIVTIPGPKVRGVVTPSATPTAGEWEDGSLVTQVEPVVMATEFYHRRPREHHGIAGGVEIWNKVRKKEDDFHSCCPAELKKTPCGPFGFRDTFLITCFQEPERTAFPSSLFLLLINNCADAQ